MKLRVFCDFDGTVAQNDVGNLVFTTFGNEDHWWKLVREWEKGELEGREMWRKQAAISRMTPSQLDEFAATQAIDPTFPGFVEFCKAHRFPVYVVSDGMDAYISRILEHNGLDDLIVLSNHMEVSSAGILQVDFPYYEDGCGACANCKGLHVSKETKPGEISIYIGDGYSDKCALAIADITFAKDDLLLYCREKNFPCRPYRNFEQVQKELQELLNGDQK